MNYHVGVVHDQPAGFRFAGSPVAHDSLLFQRHMHFVRHGAEVRRTVSGGDHKVVCEFGYIADIENNNIFAFPGIDGFPDLLDDVGRFYGATPFLTMLFPPALCVQAVCPDVRFNRCRDKIAYGCSAGNTVADFGRGNVDQTPCVEICQNTRGPGRWQAGPDDTHAGSGKHDERAEAKNLGDISPPVQLFEGVGADDETEFGVGISSAEGAHGIHGVRNAAASEFDIADGK